MNVRNSSWLIWLGAIIVPVGIAEPILIAKFAYGIRRGIIERDVHQLEKASAQDLTIRVESEYMGGLHKTHSLIERGAVVAVPRIQNRVDRALLRAASRTYSVDSSREPLSIRINGTLG